VGQGELAWQPRSPRLLGLLAELAERYPRLGPQVLERGALSPYVNVYVNGQAVRAEDAPTCSLRDGDEVLLLLPLTGGGSNP
jgi:molybdopterin synthase sulfur carrier subunit